MHQSRKVVGQKPWRNAASLIIAAPSNHAKHSKSLADFKILYLKRGAKSSFYPNAYVYPGGVFDEADKSSKWFEIFQNVDSRFCDNVKKEFFVCQNDGKRSPLFPGDEESLRRGILPNEIAFRICSIRESFEESGLLLLTDDVERRSTSKDSSYAKSLTSLLSEDAIVQWRTKIHEDAFEFLNLCKELKKAPDIWSLKEWCQWLTPIVPTNPNLKRYDTVFFICCLKEAPSYYSHDEVETSDSVWLSPADMLQRFSSKKAFLVPPQIVETSKLMRFKTLEDLSLHINERAMSGMKRILPWFIFLKDFMLETYPGDDLYPKEEEGLEFKSPVGKRVNLTLEEYISSSANKFSTQFTADVNSNLSTLQCNIKLDYNQVSPVLIKEGVILRPKL